LLAKSSGDLGKSTEDLERDAMVIAASSMEPTMITGIVTLEDVIEELLGEEIIGT
jgi:Mg2+/Co2+ transporter CorB